MDAIQKNILKEVADLDALPVGAYNIRSNGATSARNTTANIDIVTKERCTRAFIFRWSFHRQVLRIWCTMISTWAREATW